MKARVIRICDVNACPVRSLSPEHYDDEGRCKCRELAEHHWDQVYGPGLIEDGMPEDAERFLRDQYVTNVLARPHVLAELRELYPDGQ